MKKFVKMIVIFLVTALIIEVVPAVIVDPYNVFHWKDIRDIGAEPNKNYIKTRYILANPEKFDAYLLGSSRVGSIHVENIEGYKTYNMYYSAGTTVENLWTLRTLIEEGVQIKALFLGVDSLSYTEDYRTHYEQELRCPYQYLKTHPFKFAGLYLNTPVVVQSLEKGLENGHVDGYEHFYETGWFCDYGRSTGFTGENARPNIGWADTLDETLDSIEEIVSLCRENNIELTVFTNPMYDITYTASLDHRYAEFLKRLAQITDYYNFSGLNDITLNPENYLDTSHYNAEVGDMLIDVMTRGAVYEDLYEQGFGWRVNENNIGELLELIA